MDSVIPDLFELAKILSGGRVSLLRVESPKIFGKVIGEDNVSTGNSSCEKVGKAELINKISRIIPWGFEAFLLVYMLSLFIGHNRCSKLLIKIE